MKQLTTKWLGCGIIFLALSQPGLSQTLSFGDAVAGWAQVCGKDVDTYCKGVKPGNGRLSSCLAGKASPICQNATAAFKANMDARFAAQVKAPKICENDINRFCSNFRGGTGRSSSLFIAKRQFPGCKPTMQEYAESGRLAGHDFEESNSLIQQIQKMV